MKHFALIILLCLLSGLSEGTFEIEDPIKLLEEDEKARENKTPGKVPVASVKKIIVPPNVNLITPDIENNKCVGFSKDASETKADGTSVSYTVKTYLGVIRDTTECPVADTGATTPLKVALIEIDDGRLIWLDSSKILIIKK